MSCAMSRILGDSVATLWTIADFKRVGFRADARNIGPPPLAKPAYRIALAARRLGPAVVVRPQQRAEGRGRQRRRFCDPLQLSWTDAPAQIVTRQDSELLPISLMAA